MKKSNTRYWTGALGIVLYLLVSLEIPLYFVYTPTPSGTPPLNIILMRILVDMVLCMGIMGFFSGFRSVIVQSLPDYEWAATFIFALGICFAVVALVADSIQAGGAWLAKGKPTNPTFVGYGADGALLIYGPVNRLLNVLILVVGSTLTLKTNLFPKWTAWIGYLFAFYNFSFIPTLFFMTTPLDFYSVNGWNIPFAAGFFFLWILVISIYMVRRKAE